MNTASFVTRAALIDRLLEVNFMTSQFTPYKESKNKGFCLLTTDLARKKSNKTAVKNAGLNRLKAKTEAKKGADGQNQRVARKMKYFEQHN